MDLTDLGLTRHFRSQLTSGDDDTVGRVGEVHRDRIVVRTSGKDIALTLRSGRTTGEVAVGDWVTFDAESSTLRDVLERRTSLGRRAAGSGSGEQLIAANVDTMFIVTSCNADFNLARLERYLTLAATGGIMPVIVLTKADLVDDADDYRRKVERLSPIVTAVTVNALDVESLDQLGSWLRGGDTGVLVGSSGVGKSTILNALTGAELTTRSIREDDAKGRHTTTSRALKQTRTGGWLIDTPGIRQLALFDSADAIDEVFTDVSELLENCRFSDCSHETEPGCAVRAAIENGLLEPDRLRRWRKLHLEDRYSVETAEEKRTRQKAFSKQVRSAIDGRRGSKR